ncbi:MFS transporter [Paenibacillus hamazuiensis]|uniref:MFS transporter n=1 Tax=Paenibacillus hamazuiensis TaxID=2936508 RepID=UPI00200CC97E|nr:MFS transporter [Paenibacillus hamazuiensis]
MRLLWIGCFSYLLIGFTHVIIGSVLPELLHLYGKSYSAGGDLVFAQFFGLLTGVLCMPWLVRRLGRRSSLVLAFGCMTVAETWISFLPPWPGLLLLAFAAGFGFGLVESSVGTLVLRAVRDRQAVAMSRLEVFFGLGALLMPFISGFLIAYGLWTCSFWFLGLSSLCMLLFWRKLSFGEEMDAYLIHRSGAEPESSGETAAGRAEAEGTSPVKAAAAVGYRRGSLPLLIAFIAVFFMYVGSEVSLIHYLPSVFIENFSLTSSASTISVTIYWAAMVAGRMVAGFAAERAGYARYLLLTCIVSVFALIGLAVAANLWAAYALVLALGLLMAGMFSIALVYANQLLPGTTERTTSLLIASGGLGGAVMPLLLGRLMDAASASASLWCVSGAALLMFGLIGAARLGQAKRMSVSA